MRKILTSGLLMGGVLWLQIASAQSLIRYDPSTQETIETTTMQTEPAPTGMFVPPAESTSTTTEEQPVFVDSTTLFVPPESITPERDPLQPEPERQPREPQEPLQCPEPTICAAAEETINRLIPQLAETQWRTAVSLFIGGGAGFLVWLAVTSLFSGARTRRELAILSRQARAKSNDLRMNQLAAGHEKLGTQIALLSEMVRAGQTLSAKHVAEYKKAGAEMELFGSKQTRAAYHALLKTAKNSPSKEEFTAAANSFFKALKKDMGLA